MIGIKWLSIFIGLLFIFGNHTFANHDLSTLDMGLRIGVLTTSGIIYGEDPLVVNSDTVYYGNYIDYFGNSLTGTSFYFTRWRNNNIGYQIELMYYKKGGTEFLYNDPYNSTLIEVRYLEVPVLFKLAIFRRTISAYAGAFFSVRLDEEVNYGTSQVAFSDMDFGGVVGFELSYPITSWLRGVFDIRYDLSLANALINKYVDIYSGAVVMSVGGALTF